MRVLRNRDGVFKRRMRQELRFVSEYVLCGPDVRQRNVRRRLDAVRASVFRRADVRIWRLRRRHADVLAFGVQYLRRRRHALLRPCLQRHPYVLLDHRRRHVILRASMRERCVLRLDHRHHREVDVRRET